jgi:hypothetical protein
MNKESIMPLVKDLLTTQRLLDTLLCYLISLMVPADKHTQANAEFLTGKDNSLFSNLLCSDLSTSKVALNRATRRILRKISKKRKLLEKGAPWTVGILIDATLHERSSRHVENAQKFNHGKGWVVGHQWTNIGFLIADQFIPLPPIAFHTKEYCKQFGLDYKTEHEKVISYLRTLSFKEMGLNITPEEVVVLMDSGYDCKELQNLIISRGWDFISSLKCSRKFSPTPRKWKRVDEYFEDGRRPWKTIRIASYRGKKKKVRQYRYKQQAGFLKGVRRQVKLVCSQRSREATTKHLACSNMNISSKTIILCYRHRWRIEIFHREIKSHLGMEDAGVRSFKSLHNHVHWVYVAYILLKEKFPSVGVKYGQTLFERELSIRERKRSVRILSQINGGKILKDQYLSDIHEMEVKMAG